MSAEYPPAFTREEIDGVKVVRDEVYASGLSKPGHLVPIHGVRVLTLEDDTVVHGCRDCVFTGTYGDIKRHRFAEHGVAMGGTRTKKTVEEAADAGMLAGPIALPNNALSMTLHELLELGAHVDEWEEVFASMQTRLNQRNEEVAELRRQLRDRDRELQGIRRRAAKAFGIDLVEAS